MVACGLGGARALKMATAKTGRGLVPWAGIAAPLQDRELAPADGTDPIGRAFCFLPLPVSTGLPVHVNGYFELSSNRRCINWSCNDTVSSIVMESWFLYVAYVHSNFSHCQKAGDEVAGLDKQQSVVICAFISMPQMSCHRFSRLSVQLVLLRACDGP